MVKMSKVSPTWPESSKPDLAGTHHYKAHMWIFIYSIRNSTDKKQKRLQIQSQLHFTKATKLFSKKWCKTKIITKNFHFEFWIWERAAQRQQCSSFNPPTYYIPFAFNRSWPSKWLSFILCRCLLNMCLALEKRRSDGALLGSTWFKSWLDAS